MKVNIPYQKKNLIGERVKTYRKQHCITQETLTAKLQLMGLNLDRTTISKIERGERLVLDYELLFISEALQVSVKWLLTGEEV